MNWLSCDPDTKTTGITVWDETGGHLKTLTVRYLNTVDFHNKLLAVQNQYRIEFAVIEDFTYYRNHKGRRRISTYKVTHQLAIIKEIFKEQILIYHAQWNSANYRDEMKKIICLDNYGIQFKSEHERDSALIGRHVWNVVSADCGEKAFTALFELSRGARKWPRRQDPCPWRNVA